MPVGHRQLEGSRVVAVGGGIALLVVAAVAIANAASWFGRPIAGALLDPNGCVSNVGPSEWAAKRQFAFPDQAVAIDGEELPSTQRGRAWDARVLNAYVEGRREVEATVQTAAGRRTATLPLTRLTGAAWWLFAPITILAGVLWTGAALIALWVAPRSALAKTTAGFGVAVGLYFLALFDLHTSRRLVPLFMLGFATAPFSCLALGARLPDDMAWLKRHPWIERVLQAAGLALAVALIVPHFTGGETHHLQRITGGVLMAALTTFVIMFVTRAFAATGRRRRTLRTLAVAMLPPHILGALFFLFTTLGESSVSDSLIYPTLAIGPISTVYAVVRYDIWSSRALLSRVLTRVGVVVLVAVGATLAAVLAVAAIGEPNRLVMVAAAVAAVTATGATAVLLELNDRYLFTAQAAFKPTVAKLSAELTGMNSPAEVAVAIERTVKRWLDCEHVTLSFVEAGHEDISGVFPVELGPDEGRPTAAGGRVMAVSFGGRPLAQLEVGPKPGSALYTSTDLELLGTIADQSGLALAHAFAYQELEHRRKEQARAFRGERAALVETVAGEIAHEIRHPINFFRSAFQTAATGRLDDEEIEVGQEEVERLEQLVAGLRRLTGGRVGREPEELKALCERAERLLRDAIGDRVVTVDVPPEVVIRCDHDKVIQVLVNLLSNALDACKGHVGMVWSTTGGDAELVVWDDGGGFDGDPARLFAPWHTTKKHGTGLGLAITYRLVRAHDWTIRAERVVDRTRFIVAIRPQDILNINAGDEVEVA